MTSGQSALSFRPNIRVIVGVSDVGVVVIVVSVTNIRILHTSSF